jgi:hypothetical protein
LQFAAVTSKQNHDIGICYVNFYNGSKQQLASESNFAIRG